MAPCDDAGFEALLRPIQDVLTKNWEIRLAKYLENYLNHLKVGSDMITNFSEAALLLQNSAQVYCKRVDLVFEFMTKLSNALQRREDENPTEKGQTKRKRHIKNLENEELEPLDFIFSDHNINLNLNKLPSGDAERVILCTSVKVITKPNMACKLYQLNGSELGSKDEFRLHWRINSNGALLEDFNYSSQSNQLTVHRAEISNNLSHDDHGIADDGMGVLMGGDCSDHEMEPIPEELFDMQEDDADPLAQEPPVISQIDNVFNIGAVQRAKQRPKPKQDPWQPINFDFNVHELKLKKRKTFKLPKSLLPVSHNYNTRKRKRDDTKASKQTKDVSFLIHSDLVDDSKSMTTIEFKIWEETKRKNAIISKRLLKTNLLGFCTDSDDEVFKGFDVDPDPANVSGINDDYDDDRCESDADQGGYLPEIDVGLVQQPVEQLAVRYEREEASGGDSYEKDAYLTMQKYKQAKKVNNMMITGLAKRVAAWHESIQPVLTIAESRTKFDVQQYGTKILQKFSDGGVNSVKSFNDITEGQPKEEICRFFLSTLMLANTYNVEIIKTDKRDLATDCMMVKLLSVVRHHEEMDENLRVTSGGK